MAFGPELVKKEFLTSSQPRTALLGSRLKELRDAARIICVPQAHKFHFDALLCMRSA